MSCKGVCIFLLFEVIVSVPMVLLIYWLLALRTDNFQGDNMLVYLHGVLMMFAFSYMLAQGIALLRFCPSSKKCAKITHSVFNTLALVLAIAGIILIVSYKSKNGVAHFQTIHSWCGLFLLFIMLIQFVGGSIVLQSCCKGASLKSRLNYVPTHVAIGTATLLLTVVAIVSGVLNLKDHIELGPVSARELDFENSLLNLMVGFSILIFMLLLCIAVSRRTRRSINYAASISNAQPSVAIKLASAECSPLITRPLDPLPRGDKLSDDNNPAYQVDTKSCDKSKQLSCDTAYSSAPESTTYKHSQRSREDPHRRGSGGEPPARGSAADASRRGSEGDPSRGDPSTRGRERPDRSLVSPDMHSDPRLNSGYRGRESDPNSPPELRNGDPMSPGSLRSQDHRQQDHLILSPKARNPLGRPVEVPRQHTSPSFDLSASPAFQGPPHLDHRESYPGPQGPYHGPKGPYSERPYPNLQAMEPMTSPPRQNAPSHPEFRSPERSHDVIPSPPPLFETNPVQRNSRKDMTPPLNIPTSQFSSLENNFPPQYGSQVVPDEMQAQNPQTHKPLSTSYSDPLSPSFFQPTSSNQPGIMSPGIMSPGILSPEMLSPENSPPPNSPPATTFNSRPLNRHQMARHIRYETRRAKVEKANMELHSSGAPPSSSYTDSFAPAKSGSSPLSPTLSTDSIISEDVDGAVPRRGRTSYRNAVREEEPTPPPKPPKPSNKSIKLKKINSKDDDEEICWL